MKSSNLFFDMIALILRAFIFVYQYSIINFRYKNVTQSAFYMQKTNALCATFLYANKMHFVLRFYI